MMFSLLREFSRSIRRANAHPSLRSADDDGSRTQAISQALSRTQPLAGLYAPLLKQILDISKSTTVSFRTKSIRAISLIVAHDPDLFHDVSVPSLGSSSVTDRFSQTGVKNAIEARMLDSSPAVRDAALELVGKYVVSRPDLAAEYLPKICARTNVSIRFSSRLTCS